LLQALLKAKADKAPLNADSFVVNTPDEVYAAISQLRQKPTVKQPTPSQQGAD
jgi:hypothetical protein